MSARDESVLLASYACVALFIERGSTDVPVAELAENAGIARRTFHRYFETKEDSVRPVLREGMQLMASALAECPPSEPFDEALVSALASAAAGPLVHRTRGLIGLVDKTTPMRTVWSQTIEEGEVELRVPVASRFGWAASDPRASVLATVITALVRSALIDAVRSRVDPVELFRDYLSVFDGLGLTNRRAASRDNHTETKE